MGNTVGIAVVFPGQGTQQTGMALPWRDHASWSVVERAEAALGEPLAHLVTDAPAEALARTREAQLAVLLTSLVVWDALDVAERRRRRVRRSLARPGHRADRVGRPHPRRRRALRGTRRAELTQAAADAHPGKMAALLGATPEQAEDACDRGARRLLGRQRQRARTGRDRGNARRARRRVPPGPRSSACAGSPP